MLVLRLEDSWKDDESGRECGQRNVRMMISQS